MKETYEACLQTHILSSVFHEILCLVGSLSELCLYWLNMPLHLLLYFFDIKELWHLLPCACPSNLFLLIFFPIFHLFVLLINLAFFILLIIFLVLDEKIGVKGVIFFHFLNRSKGLIVLITVTVGIVEISELRIFIVIEIWLFLWKSFVLGIHIVLLECLIALVIEERYWF